MSEPHLGRQDMAVNEVPPESRAASRTFPVSVKSVHTHDGARGLTDGRASKLQDRHVGNPSPAENQNTAEVTVSRASVQTTSSLCLHGFTRGGPREPYVCFPSL